MSFLQRFCLAITIVICSFSHTYAQKWVEIKDNLNQHIFGFEEIEYFEDSTGNLTINQVSSAGFNNSFKTNHLLYPKNDNRKSTYWYRIHLKDNSSSKKNWVFEFFDQTIDYIALYSPAKDGKYTKTELGDNYAFADKSFKHKNFITSIRNEDQKIQSYYIQIKSHQRADMLIVLRSVNWFVAYALNEYFFFGIFYGMILIFCFYNLLMYIAVKEDHYLYYIAYSLSIGLYEMCADGVAFQYLWPNSPNWNQNTAGYTLFLASFFALLFGRKLLNLKKNAPKLDQLILATLALRTLFFLFCLFFYTKGYEYRYVEVIPLSVAFYVGIRQRLKGYRPARFYVLGYGFLFFGLAIKGLINYEPTWLPYGPLTHYSLSFCFVMEMIFLSFAIGDKVRLLRIHKDNATLRIIKQLRINQKLKDEHNQKLEEQVKLKTSELTEANNQLKEQAEEIARMNELLSKDNSQLKENVAKVTEARIMSKDVNFEEFSAMYPDDESCLKFLSELKAQHGYHCHKCAHTKYYPGHGPYNRRCAKCSYDESVTAYTILHNIRIPINKAFYMIFLIYTTKGNISSHKLSEILEIRQSTCWAYASKIKKALKERKRGTKTHEAEGWSALLIEDQSSELKNSNAESTEISAGSYIIQD